MNLYPFTYIKINGIIFFGYILPEYYYIRERFL